MGRPVLQVVPDRVASESEQHASHTLLRTRPSGQAPRTGRRNGQGWGPLRCSRTSIERTEDRPLRQISRAFLLMHAFPSPKLNRTPNGNICPESDLRAIPISAPEAATCRVIDVRYGMKSRGSARDGQRSSSRPRLPRRFGGHGGTQTKSYPHFPATMDVQLLASRDGIDWKRAGGRRPFLRRGPDGSLSGGMIYANPWPITVTTSCGSTTPVGATPTTSRGS